MLNEASRAVLDAVNLALGDAATQPEEPAHDEHTDAEGTAALGDDTGDAGADDADSKGGEDSDLDGAERNADGTFKAKPDAAAGEVKLDKDGKPIPEVKKSDPINDPIPKELKAETQDRMRSLIKTAKELTAERDQVKTDFDYIIKGIEASGSTPQQYGEVLSWMQLFNSNDPAQQSKALELVESVADSNTMNEARAAAPLLLTTQVQGRATFSGPAGLNCTGGFWMAFRGRGSVECSTRFTVWQGGDPEEQEFTVTDPDIPLDGRALYAQSASDDGSYGEMSGLGRFRCLGYREFCVADRGGDLLLLAYGRGLH